MNWLERAAREFSETAGKPTVKTAKTAVSSVLAVPHAGVSQISEDMAADRTPPEGGRTPSADSLIARPCATCAHFRATPGKSPDGHCTRFQVATWAAYPHGCAAGWTPQATGTPASLPRGRAIEAGGKSPR
jgi:hypothetical protein